MCNYVELLLDAPANINAEIREIGGGCQIYIINHYVMVYEYYEYEGSNLRKKDKVATVKYVKVSNQNFVHHQLRLLCVKVQRGIL